MNVLINDDEYIDRLVTISDDTNFLASKESVLWVQFRGGGGDSPSYHVSATFYLFKGEILSSNPFRNIHKLRY